MPRNLIFHWHPFLGSSTQGPEGPWDTLETGTWSPNTDIYEGPDELMIKMELAGVVPNDVQIELRENMLTVRGMRCDPHCSNNPNRYRFRQIEIEHGPFVRVVPLPHPVEGRRARAKFKDGILEIHLPRTKMKRRTTITVVVET